MSTAGQRDQARETEVSLGLMAAAANAGADMTPEQQIFLGQSEHGMRERLSVLLGIPHRSLDQEREKLAIEGWLSRGAEPAPTIRRFLPAAAPGLAILMSPVTWLVVALAAVGVQTARLNNAKGDLEEARDELVRMERSRNSYAAALGAERSARARDVAQVLEDTAETVEQMRVQAARRAAREARERARREDLANGNVDFTERLRELTRPDAGLPADAAATPGSGAPGSVPTEPRPDADDGANP